MKHLVLVLSFLVLLSACATSTQQTPSGVNENQVQKKAPNTTLTGTITKVSGKFYISDVGKAPTELDSYAVKLDEFVGKKASVTGQYSGTTLFVDSIRE